jgi:hypothetical protein
MVRLGTDGADELREDGLLLRRAPEAVARQGEPRQHKSETG